MVARIHSALPRIRSLRADERGRFLELLDGWPVGDGWSGGAALFRRYVERDPTYEDRNVWVAEEKGELLSCVHLFPRRLRTVEGEVACAGVGSVFTRPDCRGRGLARRVLEAATEAARERGFVVSLLFASLVDWYRAQGWEVWTRSRLELTGAPRHRAVQRFTIEDFDVERHLSEIRTLHQRYSSRLPGTVVRDDALWLASLRCAGNPEESIRCAVEAGRPVAYLRSLHLDGRATSSEWGYEPGSRTALLGLVALIARTAEEAAPEPLVLPRIPDPELEGKLGRAGFETRVVPSFAAMLRQLTALPNAEDRPLAELLPPDRFSFWPSDRF